MIHTKKLFNNINILLLAILFLLLDISLFSILQKKVVFSLLCFYTILLFNQSKTTYLACGALFLSIETFLLYGQSLYFLAFIIPLSFISLKLSTFLHRGYILPYIFTLAIITLEQYVLEPRIFSLTTISPYTIEKICVNILIVAIFLKYIPKGKLGDRL